MVRTTWTQVLIVTVFFLLDAVVTLISLFSSTLNDARWTDVVNEFFVTMRDDNNFQRDTFNLTPTMGWWIGFHFARIIGFIIIGSGLFYLLGTKQITPKSGIGSIVETWQIVSTLLIVLAFGLQTAQTFVIHYIADPWLTVSILIGCQVLVFLAMIGMVAYDFWGLKKTDVSRLLGPHDQKFATNVNVFAVHALYHIMIFFWITWALLWLIESAFRAVRDADQDNQERLEGIVNTTAPGVYAVVAVTILLVSTAFAKHMWVPVPLAVLFHTVGIVVRGSDSLTSTAFIVGIVVSAVAFAMMLIHLAMFTFPFMRMHKEDQVSTPTHYVTQPKVSQTESVTPISGVSAMAAIRMYK